MSMIERPWQRKALWVLTAMEAFGAFACSTASTPSEVVQSVPDSGIAVGLERQVNREVVSEMSLDELETAFEEYETEIQWLSADIKNAGTEQKLQGIINQSNFYNFSQIWILSELLSRSAQGEMAGAELDFTFYEQEPWEKFNESEVSQPSGKSNFDNLLITTAGLWLRQGQLEAVSHDPEDREDALKSFSNAQRVAQLELFRGYGSAWVDRVKFALTTDGLFLDEVLFEDLPLTEGFTHQGMREAYQVWRRSIESQMSINFYLDMTPKIEELLRENLSSVFEERYLKEDYGKLSEDLEQFFYLRNISQDEMFSDLNEILHLKEQVIEDILGNIYTIEVPDTDCVPRIENAEVVEQPSLYKVNIKYDFKWENQEGDSEQQASLIVSSDERVIRPTIMDINFGNNIVERHRGVIVFDPFKGEQGIEKFYFLDGEGMVFRNRAIDDEFWRCGDDDTKVEVEEVEYKKKEELRVTRALIPPKEYIEQTLYPNPLHEQIAMAALSGPRSEWGSFLKGYVPEGRIVPVFGSNGEYKGILDSGEIPIPEQVPPAFLAKITDSGSFVVLPQSDASVIFVPEGPLDIEEQTEYFSYFSRKHPLLVWYYYLGMKGKFSGLPTWMTTAGGSFEASLAKTGLNPSGLIEGFEGGLKVFIGGPKEVLKQLLILSPFGVPVFLEYRREKGEEMQRERDLFYHPLYPEFSDN